jgi:hypothetical protein
MGLPRLLEPNGEKSCFPRISRQKTPWESTNVGFFSFFFPGGPCFTFATRFPQLSKTISYLMLMIILPSNYTTKISTGRQLIVQFISSNTEYRHASCVWTTPGPLMGGTSNQGWGWFCTGRQQRSWSMNLGASVEPKCAMVQSCKVPRGNESRLELSHKEAWHSASSWESSCSSVMWQNHGSLGATNTLDLRRSPQWSKSKFV